LSDRIRISNEVSIALSELKFATSRSGGPGGQNVNKLETRVELIFDVNASPSLSEEEKAQILEALRSRVDSEGRIRVVAQESRSQWQNKQRAIEKFSSLLRSALKPRRKRVTTQPSLRSKELRYRKKKRLSEKKKLRKVESYDEE
jgi:ribosome-associated protein